MQEQRDDDGEGEKRGCAGGLLTRRRWKKRVLAAPSVRSAPSPHLVPQLLDAVHFVAISLERSGTIPVVVFASFANNRKDREREES